jgi:hypothetical protein
VLVRQIEFDLATQYEEAVVVAQPVDLDAVAAFVEPEQQQKQPEPADSDSPDQSHLQPAKSWPDSAQSVAQIAPESYP